MELRSIGIFFEENSNKQYIYMKRIKTIKLQKKKLKTKKVKKNYNIYLKIV